MILGGVNGGNRLGARAALSPSEIAYIKGGAASYGLRADGRAPNDWRVVRCERDVVPQAAGSALLAVGGTEVLVSIKGDIGRPSLECPDQGILNIMVDASSSEKDSMHTNLLVSEQNSELAAILKDCLGSLDLSRLSIRSGVHCWVLYVDILILHNTGNVIDAMMMAARVALLTSLRLPVVEVVSGTQESGAVEVSISPTAPHHLVFGREDEVSNQSSFNAPPIANDQALKKMESIVPIVITLARIEQRVDDTGVDGSCKVDRVVIVDPTTSEEICADDGILVGYHVPQSSSLTQSGVESGHGSRKVSFIRRLGGSKGSSLIDPGLVSLYIEIGQRAASEFEGLVRSSLNNRKLR